MPRRSGLAALALLVVACAAPAAGPPLPIGAVANEPPALAGHAAPAAGRVQDESGASLAPAAEPAPPADAAAGNVAPAEPTPTPGPRSAPAVAPEPTATPAPAADPCQSPPASGSFRAFRAPLPQVPVWNPPGPQRVGLQAGHWLTEEAPEELSRLQHGTSGGGKQEWEVNGVPQAIVETGFLTSAADRRILIGNPDLPAQGIAAGVLAFLERNAEP